MTARRSGCGPKPKLAPHDDALRARVAAEPDITLAELQAWLLAERKGFGIDMRPATAVFGGCTAYKDRNNRDRGLNSPNNIRYNVFLGSILS